MGDPGGAGDRHREHERHGVVWNIASGATRLSLPSNRSVADLSYSTDGRHLAATDPNGTVTISPISERMTWIASSKRSSSTSTNWSPVARQRLTRSSTDAESALYLHTSGCPAA